ncbi:MAG TPA: PIN domain-containing protein [Isosphaeraceae bacterium]|nr:PIN domain-containing protein [Isosphaeraceae bacterium]
MSTVFLDTVGMIAVWDTTDQWHSAAAEAYQRILAQGRQLVTTGLILIECGNASARRPYRSRVNVLRKLMEQEGMLIEPTPSEMEEAWAADDRGEAAQAGIVDHVSFVVMRRLGLTEAFTNDRHFRAAGFTVLF